MNQSEFDAKLEIGQRVESEVESLLQDDGWSILQSSWRLKKQEKSPRLVWNGTTTSLPEPDLMASRRGLTGWIEVKWKAKWVTSQGVEEIGIDADKLQPYLDIQEVTGLPILLFFVIGNQPYAIGLDDFADKARYWNGKTPSGRRIKDPDYLIKREHLEAQ